jgi:hypothetical protein
MSGSSEYNRRNEPESCRVASPRERGERVRHRHLPAGGILRLEGAAMTGKKPTLGYAASDETQTSDREGAARYYRELPTAGALLWVAVAIVLFAILITVLIYLRLSR